MDYSTVTETPGTRITREALEMMVTRYTFARSFCGGKDVLEVACGSGQGLGCLAEAARRTAGGDCTPRLLLDARRSTGGEALLSGLDAHRLPFAAASFDVVLLFEAIYYLRDPALFLRECRRLLRPGGVVVISSVNREWKDFNPSPFSTRYLSAAELEALLGEGGFRAEVLAAFPASTPGLRGRAVSLIKRAAVSMGLMPRTMRAKEILKRIFLGKLVALPPRIAAGTNGWTRPLPLSPSARSAATGDFKVLYAVGRL